MNDKNNGTTRRQWLMRLGHGVVLTGFSGAVGELATEALDAPALRAPTATSHTLPPGLYLPDNNHLTHALTSDDRFHAIPAGSETEYARPRTGPFVPQFFSPAEFAVVRRLVGLFLGEASAASPDMEGRDTVEEIAEWIDLIVAEAPAVREAARRLTPEERAVAIHYSGAEAVEELEKADPQRDWREGLGWLAKDSQQRFGKAFLDLGQDQQIQLLANASQSRERAGEGPPARLYAVLKSQVIRGFYTSRRGLDELDYQGNTYHAECPGCADHESS